MILFTLSRKIGKEIKINKKIAIRVSKSLLNTIIIKIKTKIKDSAIIVKNIVHPAMSGILFVKLYSKFSLLFFGKNQNTHNNIFESDNIKFVI